MYPWCIDGHGPLPTPRAEQQAIVRRALEADAVLRDRFAGATQVSPVTVMGPLAVNARAAGCPGLLLAGDAAGFVDPMTGDGLRFALRGGELAAQAALDELASGQPAFARLGVQRRREFQVKWRINRALRVMVGSPRALELAAVASALVVVAGRVSDSARRRRAAGAKARLVRRSLGEGGRERAGAVSPFQPWRFWPSS